MSERENTANDFACEAKRSQAVSGMFGRIAGFYDFLNRLLSLGVDQYWRKVLASVATPGSGGIILDLAAGTFDVSLALRKRYPTAIVPAMDFCLPMLKTGRKKLKGNNLANILPAVADARALPLVDSSVDCLTMAFGIRNIMPRQAAFLEMLRVLKPGGRACILEFGSGREKIWAGFYNFYLNRMLPLAGRLFSRDKMAYKYLADTICAFPAAVELQQEMLDSGFAKVWYRKLTSGIVCLHVGEKATS